MEKIDSRLDEETWLTLYVPGAVIVAAVYVFVPAARHSALALLGQVGSQAQAVLLALLGVAAAAVAGVVNHCISRWLYRCQFPWAWAEQKQTSSSDEATSTCGHRSGSGIANWFLARSPSSVAHRRFYGELLPYVALRDPGGDEGHFTKALRGKAEALAGPTGSPVGSLRHYNHVVSDLMKAWVVTQVGKRVSAEAWRYISRFRQLSDAYVAWSTALPFAVLVMVGSLGPMTGALPARPLVAVLWLLEALAGVVVAAGLYWWCLVEVITNWYQWQNELSRVFFVASEERTSTAGAVSNRP